jgi:hypothetical protein
MWSEVKVTNEDSQRNEWSVMKLRLLADFGQALFPIAFVRQRVGVRAPEFLDHFAMRHERAFRLRILEGELQTKKLFHSVRIIVQ